MKQSQIHQIPSPFAKSSLHYLSSHPPATDFLTTIESSFIKIALERNLSLVESFDAVGNACCLSSFPLLFRFKGYEVLEKTLELNEVQQPTAPSRFFTPKSFFCIFSFLWLQFDRNLEYQIHFDNISKYRFKYYHQS